MINKNESISSKALALSNIIRKKIIDSLFTCNEKNFILPENNTEILAHNEEKHREILNLIEKEQTNLEDSINKTRHNKSNSSRSKIIDKNSEFSRISNFNSNSFKISLNSNSINTEEYNNIYYDLKPDCNEDHEEINSVSEISLDSHKTDCEETKITRTKVSIIPLDHNAISEILCEYFIDPKLCKIDHYNFMEIFLKKEFFQNAIKDKEKSKNPVKYHYMRKRVCYKLYKVFGKLVI